MKYLLFFLIISLGLSVSAGTIDPKINDIKYLEYGSRHKCVIEIGGTIDSYNNSEKTHFLASAVVIRPKIVLTAAHVVNKTKEAYVIYNNEKINIIGHIIPTNYEHNGLTNSDIALCYLEKEIILDFYPELYDKQDEVGKVCSIAGWGQSGTHTIGAYRYDGKRRAGSNIIDNIFQGLLVTSVKLGKKTQLEFLIANGDSGGGLFIDQKLAGINSCIMSEDKKLDSNINDEALHTRISSHKDWIDKIIKNIERKPVKIEIKLSDFL